MSRVAPLVKVTSDRSSQVGCSLRPTSFLICCRGNSSGNNRIMANTHKKVVQDVLSDRYASETFFGAAALLGVIGP